MGQYLEELKRRKVFRVATAYAVVGWLMMEIAGLILPTFGAPEWALKSFIILIALGFPAALFWPGCMTSHLGESKELNPRRAQWHPPGACN